MNIPESLADIQEQVIKREISLIQICQEYINRIKSSSTNAFIEVFEEEALLKAEEIQKKIKSLRNRQSKIECEIADLENNIKGIDFELEINYEETIAKPNFFEEYNGKKDHLAVLMQKWEVVLEELMEIEN